MIPDKHGPKGESFEAEFRKRVINAKLEAHYFGLAHPTKTRLLHLESLDPGKTIDVSKKEFFSALEPDKIPRSFTYISAEFDAAGKMTRASRTIIYMERRVVPLSPITPQPTLFRRPDFFSLSYEIGKDELALLQQQPQIKFLQIRAHFLSQHIINSTSYIEVKSIDLNTPLDVKGALTHVVKHLETFGGAFQAMIHDLNLSLSASGVVNVILKEYYHKSLSAMEKNPLIKSFSYFLKEQHTAVFTLIQKQGKFLLAEKVAVEMISGLGSIKKILTTHRKKINPADTLPDTTKPEVKRSIQFLQAVEKELPALLTKIK